MAPLPSLVRKPDYPYEILPDGVFPCDETDFRDVFVRRFQGSSSRESIGEGFLRLRAEVARFGVSLTQWVDGSFVESKPDPGDVDVVSFCDYDALNGLVATAQQAVVRLVNGGEATKVDYRTHTFLVPSCDRAHPYYPTYESFRSYWRTWFGKTREIPSPPGPDRPGYPKGFVRMTLGNAAPTVETGRSAP